MRHFARDLRERGWTVDYHLINDTAFEEGLRRHVEKFRPNELLIAEPNSFAEVDAIQKLARKVDVPLRFTPATQFLLTRDEFRDWASGQRRLVMENHYGRMRKRSGLLMEEDGQPSGVAWNFDPENRATFKAWHAAGRPRAGAQMREEPDEITREVIEMVQREFPDNPGDARNSWLPVDRAGALRWLRKFIDERLPTFGAFEDMMAETPTASPRIRACVKS